jgi:hypothetical protein
MANVDKCVRYCEEALCVNLEENARKIFGLPNAEKVVVFRDKTEHEIAMTLRNCRETIQISLMHEFYDEHIIWKKVAFQNLTLAPSSNDNKEGADVLHKLPNGDVVDIEVKFGQKTDKAIGMKVFATIFGSNVFSEALSVKNRKSWQTNFASKLNELEQLSRLFTSLNRAINDFNSFNEKKNFTLTSGEQEAMENIIINNSGHSKNKSAHYLRFMIKDGYFEDVKRLPTKIGKWTILRVKRLENGVKRVNVLVVNKTTNLQIRYTLNWKNNYALANKGSAPAKLGLGSPSWNVWVEADVTELS